MTQTIEKGSILAYSWGYEQTNWDFYQVISRTTKSVIIRKIRTQDSPQDQFMTSKVLPLVDVFAGEPMRKKIQSYEGREYLSMDYGVCNVWDGSAQTATHYA